MIGTTLGHSRISAVSARLLFPFAVAVLLARLVTSQVQVEPVGVSLPPMEAGGLAEAFRLVEERGDEIWPGFGEVPFPVLLVTEKDEFLIGWEAAVPEGFASLGVDPMLQRQVLSRQATYPPTIQASFPAFGLPAVAVVGTAKATGRSSTDWVLMLLHEHLHQVQYAAPGYYDEVEALGLAGDDETGMWMLEYPFPYDDEDVHVRFAELAAALRSALVDGSANGADEVPWTLLRDLLDDLEILDARYLSFQLWQEGVGRYIELKAAAEAAEGFESQAVSWKTVHDAAHQRLLRDLEALSLSEERRVAFYPVGAALGLLLDLRGIDWKSRYLTEKFSLHTYTVRTGPAAG